MKNMRIQLLIITLLVFALLPAAAQQDFWSDAVVRSPESTLAQKRQYKVDQFRALALDATGMRAALAQAPMEGNYPALKPVAISIPMPDGSAKTFEVVESPVMADGLAARYPSIKTYKGWNPADRRETLRMGYSPKGFHATVLSKEGAVYIDRLTEGAAPLYMSYFVNENPNPELRQRFQCGLDQEELTQGVYDGQVIQQRSASEPITLRTYRLAMAGTAEYSNYHGDTKEEVLAAMVLKVNRLNQVFERDLAIRVELIENNDLLIFFDEANDGLSNGDTQSLLQESRSVIEGQIEFGDYDVGHVLNVHDDAVGNGVARLQSACTANKARGISGITEPEGDPFVIDIVAHEFGHQFGASHTQNSCQNVQPETAFSPGSGTTIMSYAGICPFGNNVQFTTDDYYHTASLQQIFSFTREGAGDSCPEKTPLNNTTPEVTIELENGFFIPVSTPFQLTASGADAEDDDLTYCWEQFDLGPNNVGLGNPQGNSPLFRSFPPTASPTRVFPQLSNILFNTSDKSEVLPEYGRDLTFRCTVRDNHPGGGGADWARVQFASDSTAGPFRVEAPNSANTVWNVGGYEEVRWDVANTNNERVNCQAVNIKLSTDGGFTYPITLAENVINDGSFFVTVPDAVTNGARIRVEAADNIFFDLSNASFRIEPPQEPGYSVSLSMPEVPLLCLPEDTLALDISTTSLLGFDSTLHLELLGDLPAGTEAVFGVDSLQPGQSTSLTVLIPPQPQIKDTFDFQLRVIAENADTALRPLRVVTRTNDYSALQMQVPADGNKDILFTTDFTWNDVPAADAYDIQIATQADFSEATMVESATGLTDTIYEPEFLFEEAGEIYFWRIRPISECGPGEFLPPFAFQVPSVECENSSADDLPVTLPNSPTVRRSRIFVEESGTISDINISNVSVTFSPLNAIRVSVVSPAGTEVILFDQICFGALLRASFDDEAPDDFDCLSTDFSPVIPVQPLAAFDGEDTFGEWQLVVEVVDFGNGGGSIQDWNLEFCASLTPPTPTIITNDTLGVPPGEGNTITQDQLEAEDGVSQPSQLEFKLLTVPEHGQLFRGGDPLEMGDEFTQLTVNAFNLTYEHDGDGSLSDQFTFIVNNDEGGWIPTQVFNIEIDEDAVVSSKSPELEETLSVFPNPTSDLVTLAFGQLLDGPVQVSLFNLQGQQLQQRQFNQAMGNVQLNVSEVPAGIYLLNVRTEQGMATRKLIVR